MMASAASRSAKTESGKCFRDFQYHVRDLRNNGVLLGRRVEERSRTGRRGVDQASDDGLAARRLRASGGRLGKQGRSHPSAGGRPFAGPRYVRSPGRQSVRAQSCRVRAARCSRHSRFPTRPELLSDWFLSKSSPNFFPRVRVLDEDRAEDLAIPLACGGAAARRGDEPRRFPRCPSTLSRLVPDRRRRLDPPSEPTHPEDEPIQSQR